MARDNDAWDDLRAFFEGSLETVSGHRSSMGGQLDRMQYNLPFVPSADPEVDMDRILHELRRNNRVREALVDVEGRFVLRTCYSPIPLGSVWGLVTECGKRCGEPGRGREVAAVVVNHLHVGPPMVPGDSGWSRVNAVKRKATNGSKSAAEELDSVCKLALRMIKDAEANYYKAWIEARKREREERFARFERSVKEALRG